MRPAFPSLLFLAAAATLPAQTVVSLNGASGAVSHATSRSTDGGLSIGLGFEVEYLVVGGGGGGGNGYDSGPGGGGGAGGLTQGSIALGSGTHGVTVGAGGAGGTSGSGANGGNSSLGDILMLGGGGGGGSRGNGLAGGSGGGAGGRPLGGNRTGGGASSGFGNAGGNNYGAFAGDISYGGGGGGGAASAGQSRTSANASTNAGIWGEGITSSIDGTSRQYAFGGYGGYANFTSTGTNATIIGGGGAGASINVNGASRAGGSGAAGAVIVRYLGAAAGTGGTVSSVAVPGYTVHSFTTAGSSSLDLSGLNLNTRLGASQDAAISGSGDLTFTGPGTLTLNAANTYTGSTVVNAGTLALGASGSLSASTVVNVASGAAFNLNGRTQTVAGLHGAGSVQLGSGALTVNDASNRTLSGAISGSGSFAKSGGGTLTLTAASTHSGGTTVNGGTLQVGVAPTWAASMLGTGAITVNAGTLQALNHHQFGFASGTHNAITLNDGATLATGAYDQFLGALAINGNVSITGSGNYVGLAGGTLNYVGGSSKQAIVATALALSDSNGAMNATLSVTGTNVAGDLVVSGVIWQNGAGLTKTGTGTLVLSNANTFTGGTTLSAGAIRVGNNSALGTGTATLNGGALSSSSSTAHSLANNVTLGGNVTLGDATNNGALTLSGTVGLGGATRTLTVASGVTLAGIVSNGALTKAGAGTLTLGAANTYTGSTTVSAGTLALGASGSLSTSTVVEVASGATFNLNGRTQTVAGLHGAGAVQLGNGVLTVSDSSNRTLSGTISGTGSLAKSGSGTLTLGAANTYTGVTTVNAGTLALGASGSISDSSTVNLASGATLDVSAKEGFTLGSGQTLTGGGTVVGDTVIAGTHTPGFSPGLQTFADNVTYADGSTVVWELAAGSTSGRGTIFDGIDVQGNLAFQGTVNLSLVFDLAGSDVDWTAPFWDSEVVGTAGWKVFGVTGTVNGFANLQIANAEWLDANGAAFATARPQGGFTLYQGGDGIYLNYTPVPEPSTYGLILGALALAGAAVRRRKISK